MCGQHRGLFIPQERGWPTPPFQCPHGELVALVHEAPDSSSSQPCAIQGPARRWPKPYPDGLGRLQFKPVSLFPYFAGHPPVGVAPARHVCFPGQYPVSPLCWSVPTLAGGVGRFHVLQPQSSHRLLCEPPLDHHPPLAQSFGGPPQSNLPYDHPLLGFSCVVSPIAAVAKKRQSGLVGSPHWGLFTDCSGVAMPPTRWPLLCTVLSGSCYTDKPCPMRPLTLF